MFFEPYKGERYMEGYTNGLRLLILGESHYHKGYNPSVHDPPPFATRYTIEQVECFLKLEVGKSYDNGIAGRLHRVLSGIEKPTELQARAAWSRVAYANYIQKFVGDGAWSHKTRAHWQSGEDALKDILEELAPDRILIFGKGTWNHIHFGRWRDKFWVAGGRSRGLWEFSTLDSTVPATWIMHPSWGRDSVPVMREVLGALMATR